MSRRRATTGVVKPRADEAERHGLAGAVGWYLLLALVALTPLALGALPPGLGAIASVRAYDPFSLTKTVTLLVLSGLSLAAFSVAVLRREADVYWHPLLWIVVAIFGWGCVSTVFSTSVALSLWGSPQRNDGLVALFGYTLVAFLAVQYVRSIRALRALMVTAAVAGALVSTYALLQFVGVDPYAWANDIGRVFATFGNADILGTYLVFPLALALGLALSAEERRSSIAWWAVAVVIASALAASETRGGWIGGLAVLLCLAYAAWGGSWKNSRRQHLVLGALAAVIVMGVVGVVLIRPNLAWNSIASSSLLERLSNGRTLIWAIGLRAWLARPITGWGPDSFARAFRSAVDVRWYAVIAGYQSADNAHNFLVQRLVTFGAPGLVLMLWALVQAGVTSVGPLRLIQGRERFMFAAAWGALIGLAVASLFGLTVPEVSVWLWLTLGLLAASSARPVPQMPRPAAAAGIAIGIGLAIWAGSWLAADVIVGEAMELPVGPAQVAALQAGARLNPLSEYYRGLTADALLNEGVAEQHAGQQQLADQTILRAINAYAAAAQADRGDALIRAAMANILIGYARNHPSSGAAEQAVQAMQEAQALAPHDAAVLVTLARAYHVAGRNADAHRTAQEALQVAPAYAAQALTPLGLGGTSP